MKSNIQIVPPIKLEIEGFNYTLTFNRKSVVIAEQLGLRLADIEKTPMTTIPLLFFCSFLANHPDITREKADEIYFDKLKGLTAEEVKRLGELYAAPTQALINDGDGERKNAKISL